MFLRKKNATRRLRYGGYWKAFGTICIYFVASVPRTFGISSVRASVLILVERSVGMG